MSRKSVPFSVPEGAARPAVDRRSRREPGLIDAQTDEWVSDRNSGAQDSAAGPGLVFDLAAERSLIEIAALGVMIPFALGWFWLINAMSGRMRF
jgi:hypothetical protein